MTETPLLSIIIPVFNNWDLTRACLESLDACRPPCPFEVVVTDNGSSDATAGELEPFGASRFGASFRRIRFETNRAFARGCNAGARAAGAPLLFFLNNDTLLTPGWAAPLLDAFAADPALGAAGPLLLYADGTVQHLGICFGTSDVSHLYRGFPREHAVTSRRRSFQAITAAALLIPAALFRELGGFYEGYRNGFEDVDLCLRIKALGKRLVCIPESVVVHLESKTPGRHDNAARNAALLSRRCAALVTPDVHIFGSGDGFRPFVTDRWSLALAMRAEDEEELTRLAAHLSPDERFALTRDNPLWTAGRFALSRTLLARGDSNRGLLLFAEAADILQSAAVYAAWAQVVRSAGDRALYETANGVAADVAASRVDRALARRVHDRIVSGGDLLLQQLFDAKLRETFA